MPAGAATLSQAYDDQKKRKSTVAIAVVSILIGVAILFGAVKGLGALGVWGKKNDNDALGVNGKMPDLTILTANGKPINPVLTAPAADQKKMPDDVYNWLRHLEKCEAMKQEIAGDQNAEAMVFATKLNTLGAAVGLMDPYDQSNEGNDDQSPDSYTKGKILDFKPQWEQLITYFDSVAPPDECKPIADDFDHALTEIPAMAGDVADVLNSVGTDPAAALQKINKMKNASYSGIDRYFARCDNKVSGICAKYQVTKWFNIKTDVSAGGMLGANGGGMGLPSMPGMSGMPQTGLPGGE